MILFKNIVYPIPPITRNPKKEYNHAYITLEFSWSKDMFDVEDIVKVKFVLIDCSLPNNLN